MGFALRALRRTALSGACGVWLWSVCGVSPADAEQATPWLEIDAPSSDEVVRSPIDLIELRGRVGEGERGVYDVVIALDVSQSAFLPTGLDLDADASIGALRRPEAGREVSRGPFQRWTTDADDAVVRAEIAAARRLLASLHPTQSRVALLRYAGRAHVMAPLGSVAAAQAALARWEPRPELTGTSLAAAVSRALRELEASPGEVALGAEGGRKRAILVLASDGLATAAQRSSIGGAQRSERLEERLAADEARDAAAKANAAGVRVYTFEIQNQEDEDPGLLAQMSQIAEGRYVYVADPAALAFELPNPDFVTLAGVSVENRTSARAARAVRVFSNGEFDAFVPLSEGENWLQVRAELPDGRTLSSERRVYFTRPPRAYPSDTARVEGLRDELRRRTQETLALPPVPSIVERSGEGGRTVKVQVPNLSTSSMSSSSADVETTAPPEEAPEVNEVQADPDARSVAPRDPDSSKP